MRCEAYLPGTGDTLINKGVLPGRGLSIALRWADPCDHLKCRWLGCVISWWGGLRSRYPLHNQINATAVHFDPLTVFFFFLDNSCSCMSSTPVPVCHVDGKPYTNIRKKHFYCWYVYLGPFDYINILTYKPDHNFIYSGSYGVTSDKSSNDWLLLTLS